MKFSLTIDCDNAAFADEPWREAARILDEAARKLRGGQPDFAEKDRIMLFDINGNRVGHCGFRT
jgi:hypothetical protein